MEQKDNLNNYEMSVPLGVLRKMVNKLQEWDDNTELSFTMVMVALFPNAYENIKKYGAKMYKDGYLKGKEDQDENKVYELPKIWNGEE